MRKWRSFNSNQFNKVHYAGSENHYPLIHSSDLPEASGDQRHEVKGRGPGVMSSTVLEFRRNIGIRHRPLGFIVNGWPVTVHLDPWGREHILLSDFSPVRGKESSLRGSQQNWEEGTQIPHVIPVPTNSQPPHCQHPPSERIAADELTLTHHDVYTGAHSWCCAFYGIRQMYMFPLIVFFWTSESYKETKYGVTIPQIW